MRKRENDPWKKWAHRARAVYHLWPLLFCDMVKHFKRSLFAKKRNVVVVYPFHVLCTQQLTPRLHQQQKHWWTYWRLKGLAYSLKHNLKHKHKHVTCICDANLNFCKVLQWNDCEGWEDWIFCSAWVRRCMHPDHFFHYFSQCVAEGITFKWLDRGFSSQLDTT